MNKIKKVKDKKVAMKIVNNYNNVYYAGYCDLQTILMYIPRDFYNEGVYGWNCDIYIDQDNDLLINTGYRNLREKPIPRELIDKYEGFARNILLKSESIGEKLYKLNLNRKLFIKELLGC